MLRVAQSRPLRLLHCCSSHFSQGWTESRIAELASGVTTPPLAAIVHAWQPTSPSASCQRLFCAYGRVEWVPIGVAFVSIVFFAWASAHRYTGQSQPPHPSRCVCLCDGVCLSFQALVCSTGLDRSPNRIDRRNAWWSDASAYLYKSHLLQIDQTLNADAFFGASCRMSLRLPLGSHTTT